MADDPKHPATAAWQDVEQVLAQEPGLHVLKILIADARAADAQQIAVWRKMFESSEATLADLRTQSKQEQTRLWDAVIAVDAIEFRNNLENSGDLAERIDRIGVDLSQQIAALRAELVAEQDNNGELRELLVSERAKYLAQLTALQAEQAQWQQKVAEIIDAMRSEGPRYKSHDLGYVDSVSANRVDDWADELAALTAQPDGSLPTRQPKP